MALFQDLLIAGLVASVLLLGLLNFQFGLLTNYSVEQPKSSNPDRIGQNLSYISQLSAINATAGNIQEKIIPTNSTGLQVPIISDAVGYFYLIKDLVTLVFEGVTMTFTFFTSMGSELTHGTPLAGIGVYVDYLLGIVLVLAGLAALFALVGRVF